MSYLTKSLEKSHLCLTYNDLRNGGALATFVKEFTFFMDVSPNDAFLDLINFTGGCESGNGLCENMVRYNNVSLEACCIHIRATVR